jgi:hypothetical protein
MADPPLLNEKLVLGAEDIEFEFQWASLWIHTYIYLFNIYLKVKIYY